MFPPNITKAHILGVFLKDLLGLSALAQSTLTGTIGMGFWPLDQLMLICACLLS